eukprot:TRINITY_DN22838_c0_g1_i1.p1 TRINITY_DN22838_c0_g1~~TRINITY_DN22838_c0_g1_i1.p1  ORF type:complete len:479 (+),score=87.37 TRINITY_DN22838_c0_g1_i1:33-1469(+)
MSKRRFLEQLDAPGGVSWKEYVDAEAPCEVDGCLAGRWGDCLVAAVVAEHTGGPGSAAGQVIDHMIKCGHRRLERAADRLENAAHKAMRNGTALPVVASSGTVRGAPCSTTARSAEVSGSGSSGSGSSRGSSNSHDLSDETQKLLDEAPYHAQIASALEEEVGSKLPDEVCHFFSSRHASVVASKLLKISFHATWLVDLAPPLCHNGREFARVIVQIIGAELCDKAIYGYQPVTAATLVRASELATSVGVPVATILGTGKCNSSGGRLGSLDFVAQEFIQTDTVEDEVAAPDDEFIRIRSGIRKKFETLALENVDTEPLVRFESLNAQLDWLLTQVPVQDNILLENLGAFAASLASTPFEAQSCTLVHQDDHQHNILCSKSKSGQGWVLDAVIDWESAAIVDPRLMNKEEPWSTARSFSIVVKGASLAAKFARGSLPRCELSELVEGYERQARELHERGWLPYESWATRVARHRAALA